MRFTEIFVDIANTSHSATLDVTIGPINWKKCITFGGAPFPVDCGSIFHFPHCCGIGDFRRFISISHSHCLIFVRLGKMTDVDKVTNPQHFGRDPVDIRIRINSFSAIRIRIPDHFWLKFWRWRRFALSEGSLVSVLCCKLMFRRGIFSDYDHLCKSSPAPAPVTTSKCHIPSERSAFCPPLLNRYVGHRRTPLGGSTLSSVTLHNASPVEAQ